MAAGNAFGAYVHVPFCRTRCGYCDFNTYTPGELGGAHGADPESYLQAVLGEMQLAKAAVSTETAAGATGHGIDTVFFGGGTPTLLSAAQLSRLVRGLRDTWGIAPGAEVSVEANPDTMSGEFAVQLAELGVTRVSVGMQSAVGTVLRRLDRTHDPMAVARAVDAVRAAGLSVSVDVIYGTPGESLEDWRHTLDAVAELRPDHVSAYALTIEPGTAMYRKVSVGECTTVDGDDQAAKYEIADQVLGAAGLRWYEISNWARTRADRCQHNVGYWNGSSWWGFGPGAHSYVGGRRWWNVKHPAKYALAVEQGSPAADGENLSEADSDLERVMLGIRLADGLPVGELSVDARAAIPALQEQGLLVVEGLGNAEVVALTLRGRLLADTVTRALT